MTPKLKTQTPLVAAALEALVEEIAAPVTVTIADTEYRLAYKMSAVILYKQKTGDNLFHVKETWSKIGPSDDPERFLFCLWAGLQLHHPEITVEQLGSLVDFGNAGTILEAIVRALTQYFPKSESDAGPNEAAPVAPAPPKEILPPSN